MFIFGTSLLLFSAHIYNMEGKSSTQNAQIRRFFYTVCQLIMSECAISLNVKFVLVSSFPLKFANIFSPHLKSSQSNFGSFSAIFILWDENDPLDANVSFTLSEGLTVLPLYFYSQIIENLP